MPTSRDDQQWRAFCYLSGDLSPQEIARFEAELAESQAARETLAAEAELFSALMLADRSLDSPAVGRPPRPSRQRELPAARRLYRGLVAAAVVAAAVVLAVLWQATQPWRPSAAENNSAVPVATGGQRPADPSELATLWIDQATQTNASPLADLLDEPLPFAGEFAGVPAADESGSAWDPALDAAIDDADSSEWMLAAVSGMAAERHAN